MMRVERLSLFVLFAALLFFAGASGQAHANYEDRFKLAEQYLTFFGEGKYEEAHALLATDETLEDFMQRIAAVNRHFEHELHEKRGFSLTGRQVARVTPLLFEDTYIIVNVATLVTAEENGRPIQEIMNSGVYFRFNEENQIEMVHAIGEGWLC
jgi:hypothetical protein